MERGEPLFVGYSLQLTAYPLPYSPLACLACTVTNTWEDSCNTGGKTTTATTTTTTATTTTTKNGCRHRDGADPTTVDRDRFGLVRTAGG